MANQGQIRKRKIGRSKLRYRDTKRETADSTIGTQRHERRDTRFSLPIIIVQASSRWKDWKYSGSIEYRPATILDASWLRLHRVRPKYREESVRVGTTTTTTTTKALLSKPLKPRRHDKRMYRIVTEAVIGRTESCQSCNQPISKRR